MPSDVLSLRNVGPIREADVHFGDLTVLVGPQATGKSIFLQFLKLLLDTNPIFRSLREHGADWGKKREDFFELYFGEGTAKIWDGSRSQMRWRGATIDIDNLVRPKKGSAKERSFFVPAQRVLALSRDGWLRTFGDYNPGDPYAVRYFADTIRLFMERSFVSGDVVFPQPKRLKSEIRKMLNSAMFSGFDLKVEKHRSQKRLVLTVEDHKGRKSQLPFTVWSAGQREFVPLLLGLYWLMPPTKVKRHGAVEWVMIEELEMGLHPRAISVMVLMVLDLLWRGYRVCLSTHSPHVLDLVWALRVFRDRNADPKHVLKLFDAPATPGMMKLATAALKATTRVYYFDRIVHDISKLDPSSNHSEEAGWGGLTEFSGRVTDEVSRVVAETE